MSSDKMNRASKTAAICGLIAFVAITAAWLAERRGVEQEGLGEGLVAVYDGLLQRDRAGLRP